MKFERAYIDEINESIDDLMKKKCIFAYEVHKNRRYKDFGCNGALEFYRDVLCVSLRHAQYLIRFAEFVNECEDIAPGWIWNLSWSKLFMIVKIADAQVVCGMKDKLINASYGEIVDIVDEIKDRSL